MTIEEVLKMAEQEYRDMYAEYCMEGWECPTEQGFNEFKAYRKRVESFFDKRAESS